MCGFTGVFEYGRALGSVTESILTPMRETLYHRGPDGAGNYVSPDQKVGLAHRRLAIVDLAGGAQPMLGQDGSWLVFNGEIYNYPELRQRLERDGACFATDCDTEVILHLYARYGANCVNHLNGMFAFVLWDPRLRQIFFARDRVGEKPLYWTTRNGRFIFGSEIKAILVHPGVTAEVNEAALAPYLANLVTSSPDTLYSGIHKLAPGTRGICNESGVQINSYWSVFTPREFIDIPDVEAAATVRRMLDDSVSARLMSDVPVGILLSGGLDSTTLVALLHERSRGIPTFSVGTADDPTIDERDEARWVAKYFDTDHHEIVVGEQDALDFLPALVHHQDEPLADPVCIPLHFVCDLARREGVPVVLAGEGADELFWGYPRYIRVMRQARALMLASHMPKLLRRQLPRLVQHAGKQGAYDLASGIANGRMPPIHSPLGLNALQRQSVLARPSTAIGWSPSDGDVPVRRDFMTNLAFDTQEYEFGLRLPELLLMRVDRFSMANSVEARVPFLDPNLVEFAYRLSMNHKLSHGVTKIVLKNAVNDIVPDRIIKRRKQGFGAPVARWFQGRLGPTLTHFLDQDTLAAYFDTNALKNLLARHQAGDPQTFVLWPVLNFALWHKAWVEGEDLSEHLATVGFDTA